MDLYEASCHLGQMLENLERDTAKLVYLRTDPEVPDFTNSSAFKIFVHGGRQRVIIDVNKENVISVMSLLNSSLFDKENLNLLTWNLKSLFSYFRFFVSKLPVPVCSVIDLQIVEKFLGIQKSIPENLLEAVNRTQTVTAYKSWKPVYKALHLPLMLRVLPAIETTPILDEQARSSVYGFYEIEGQTNGRLRCVKKFDKGYLPHTLGPEQRKVLKPRGYNKIFMCFDIRYCEVAVLQWLSQDQKLKEIMESGEDLYEAIYHIITGDLCDSEKKRNLTKLMFLPVMYGCGPKQLAKNLALSEALAEELIGRLTSKFRTALDYLLTVQDEAKAKAEFTDYHGRPRKYDNDFYQARNQVIQAAAATACLEKLVAVEKVLEEQAAICFTIHDGYGLVVNSSSALGVYKTVNGVLETESILCPGLLLQAKCKVGNRLDDMKTISKKESRCNQ